MLQNLFIRSVSNGIWLSVRHDILSGNIHKGTKLTFNKKPTQNLRYMGMWWNILCIKAVYGLNLVVWSEVVAVVGWFIQNHVTTTASQAKGPFGHILQQGLQQVRNTRKMKKVHVVWSFLGHNFDQSAVFTWFQARCYTCAMVFNSHWWTLPSETV